MMLPSRVVSYDNSIIPKIVIAMEFLEQGCCDLVKLYKNMEGVIIDVCEFLDIIDCLYLLGKIDINSKKEVIYYVKENNDYQHK